MSKTETLENRWETVRTRFQLSPMAETRLTTLAENASAKSWPLRGVDETPSKYFDATLEELVSEFNLNHEQISLLVEILEETLVFDEGYTAMISPEIEGGLAEDQITSSLSRLGIPADFPVELTGLSVETIELCELEGVRTVGDFAGFSQRIADNVVLSGDFRSILNALAHGNEQAIARFLPSRPGKPGLQFPEAVGLIIRKLNEEEREALAAQMGYKAVEVPVARVRSIAGPARERLDNLLARVLGVLAKQSAEFVSDAQSGARSPERAFIVLDDPLVEHIAVNLVQPMLRGKVKAVEIPSSQRVLNERAAPAPAKPGLFGRLFAIFRKK